MTTSHEESKLICLWTVPRSCSTVFERAVANRTDMEEVFHEPLGVPYYYGPKEERGSQRYADAEDRETFDEMLDEMKKSKEKANDGNHVFSKDMAYYLAGPDGSVDPKLLNKVVNAFDVHTFLIKNPIRQIPSLHRMSTEQTEETGWSTFDPREVGFNEIKVLVDAVAETTGKEPIIVDADELVANPRDVLESYCEAVGLPFEEERMLHWEAEDTATTKKFEEWKGWHDHALTSTGWGTPNNGARKQPIPPDAREEVGKAIADASPIYEELYENRLKPASR
jgi:hypothetical protein